MANSEWRLIIAVFDHGAASSPTTVDVAKLSIGDGDDSCTSPNDAQAPYIRFLGFMEDAATGA